MKKQERLLYKIWNKKNEQYVSGNGKTHWRSIKWIASKLRDLHKFGWEMKHFEVQTFELQLIDVQPAESIYRLDENKRKEKMMNKEIADKCKSKIHQYFPNIGVHQIRSMYRDGLLNSDSMALLKPIMIQLIEAERNS